MTVLPVEKLTPYTIYGFVALMCGMVLIDDKMHTKVWGIVLRT